jgi:hypothetical protein
MGSCLHGWMSLIAYSKNWFFCLKILSMELDSGCNVQIMKRKKCLLFKAYIPYSNTLSQIYCVSCPRNFCTSVLLDSTFSNRGSKRESTIKYPKWRRALLVRKFRWLVRCDRPTIEMVSLELYPWRRRRGCLKNGELIAESVSVGLCFSGRIPRVVHCSCTVTFVFVKRGQVQLLMVIRTIITLGLLCSVWMHTLDLHCMLVVVSIDHSSSFCFR